MKNPENIRNMWSNCCCHVSALFRFSWHVCLYNMDVWSSCSTNVWLCGTRRLPDKSRATWFTCGQRSPFLLGGAHPHTMWVQRSVLLRVKELEQRWRARRGEDGERAVTQEMERERSRESACDRGRDSSNDFQQRHDKHFLRASAIWCLCCWASSALWHKRRVHVTLQWYRVVHSQPDHSSSTYQCRNKLNLH